MDNTISVTVKPEYIAHQSKPEQNRYAFAYHITIRNTGDSTVKLLSRYWKITDAHNGIEEVSGDGVIGKQPAIGPGSSFNYTSGVVLKTPVGTMEGSYHMLADNGDEFDTIIPLFLLSSPGALH